MGNIRGQSLWRRKGVIIIVVKEVKKIDRW
jgi:hypothetical protein